MTHREQLLDIHRRMLDRYGPQRWWPGETRFDVMVGAVLTQATAWVNVEKALANLKAADVLSPAGIRSLDEPELARLVYPSGYYNSKARKLKALVDYLGRRFGDDLDAMAREDMASLRSELLAVYGIGEETADDILLFGLGMPSFIVDNYTRRILSRLGILDEKASYTIYRAFFIDNLPEDRDLFSDYHGLIVRHAKVACRKRPLCHDCCLLDICPTGQNNLRTA
jgi:endonuclease-3 related protein